MFYEGDIQSGIGLALQQSKAVLCFIHDDTPTSAEWEDLLKEEPISTAIASQAVALRLLAGSQEAGFLAPICTINSTPAVIVIKNAQLQQNLQAAQVSTQDLRKSLTSAFGLNSESEQTAETEAPPEHVVEHVDGRTSPVGTDTEQEPAPEDISQSYLDLQPAPGQMRLPNNAYDALRNYTQQLLDEDVAPSEIFQTQLTLLNNIPIFAEEVARLRRGDPPRELSEYARSRLLRLPAVGLKIPRTKSSPASVTAPSESQQSATASPDSSTTTAQGPVSASVPAPAATPAPPLSSPSTQSTSSRRETPSVPSNPAPTAADAKQKAQRAEYIRMQREREQKARDERERIKTQIKADREERRRIDELRKQGQQAQHVESGAEETSAYARSGSRRGTPQNANADVRIQVRTFDGSTLRNTFPCASSLSSDVRPWIDSAAATQVPYDLKLILTPLPNRTIEAGEEESPLTDLGIVGSCTLVMVPVKGYVDSYAGPAGASGLLGSVVSGGYSLVSGTAGVVYGGVKSLLGYAASPQTGTQVGGSAADSAGAEGDATPAGPPVRVRTLADQRAEANRKDQQFYNGNQLNFEPKKDDTEKKD